MNADEKTLSLATPEKDDWLDWRAWDITQAECGRPLTDGTIKRDQFKCSWPFCECPRIGVDQRAAKQ